MPAAGARAGTVLNGQDWRGVPPTLLPTGRSGAWWLGGAGAKPQVSRPAPATRTLSTALKRRGARHTGPISHENPPRPSCPAGFLLARLRRYRQPAGRQLRLA